MKLRKHQKKCIDKIDEHLKIDNKALVKMFCGAGKSFVIYHCLLQYLTNIIVVVVPSINLITHFSNDYLLKEDMAKYNKNNFNKKFKTLVVCSKDEVKDNKSYVTTNEKDIQKFLDSDDKKIVLITYQSLETFVKIFRKTDGKIDMMCFDEAHHILGDKTKELLFGNDDEFDYDEDITNSKNSDSDSNSDKSDNDESDDDSITFFFFSRLNSVVSSHIKSHIQFKYFLSSVSLKNLNKTLLISS